MNFAFCIQNAEYYVKENLAHAGYRSKVTLVLEEHPGRMT